MSEPEKKVEQPIKPFHTARELLAKISPDHAWHTITEQLEDKPKSIVFDCSCGKKFGFGEKALAKRGISLEDAKYALRNVPLPTKTKPEA